MYEIYMCIQNVNICSKPYKFYVNIKNDLAIKYITFTYETVTKIVVI